MIFFAGSRGIPPGYGLRDDAPGGALAMGSKSMNRIPRGSAMGAASIAPIQNAPNARISTITVATVVVITVNLWRGTVRLAMQEI